MRLLSLWATKGASAHAPTTATSPLRQTNPHPLPAQSGNAPRLTGARAGRRRQPRDASACRHAPRSPDALRRTGDRRVDHRPRPRPGAPPQAAEGLLDPVEVGEVRDGVGDLEAAVGQETAEP